jgi:hypothetical protein
VCCCGWRGGLPETDPWRVRWNSGWAEWQARRECPWLQEGKLQNLSKRNLCALADCLLGTGHSTVPVVDGAVSDLGPQLPLAIPFPAYTCTTQPLHDMTYIIQCTVFNLMRFTHARHYTAPYINESAAGKGLELRRNRHVRTMSELRRGTTRDFDRIWRSGRG